MNKKYKYTKEELVLAVKNSLSIAGVCRILNIRPVGGNYKTLKNIIKENNIDTSHFTGAAWNVGENYVFFGKKYELSEVLIKDSPYKSSTSLKKRLFKEGLKQEVCEICKLTEWMGKKISLELHHKNGNNTDNRIKNLQILCPNCHSNTKGYRGNNPISFKSEERKKIFLNKNLLDKKVKPICLNCDNVCYSMDAKFCSNVCYRNFESKKIPSSDEIMSAFEKYKSFVRVAEFFKVSDNAVRKWCKKYEILELIKKYKGGRWKIESLKN